MGHAIDMFREQFDPTADPLTAKRQSLYFTRRGGKGKPSFISLFLDGAGTTCGEWTRPMVRNPDGTVIKGFMKASVAVEFCPAECPYCYLNMPYTDGMDVALNWEDLADELQKKWRRYRYPINFGETSGLVEYDERFAVPDGTGSMIQFIIDACADAEVTPFFLTKIRYPRYLRFDGKVQVGISLMPEPGRTWLAPNGSPVDELLDSLAWAWSVGAVDPVMRLTVIWQQKEVYPNFLRVIRDCLGIQWAATLHPCRDRGHIRLPAGGTLPAILFHARDDRRDGLQLDLVIHGLQRLLCGQNPMPTLGADLGLGHEHLVRGAVVVHHWHNRHWPPDANPAGASRRVRFGRL